MRSATSVPLRPRLFAAAGLAELRDRILSGLDGAVIG